MALFDWQSAYTLSDLPVINPKPPIKTARIKSVPEDFIVYEVPKYTGSGFGHHIYLWVRKKNISGGDLLRILSGALKIDQRLIGTAGTKDRRAVTFQWVSIPREFERRLRFLDLPGISVLKTVPGSNKIKTGHLWGNRFIVRLRGVDSPDVEGIASAIRQLKTRGFPNLFGTQRFGNNGSNLWLGLDMLEQGNHGRRRRMSPFKRRMAISAVQSALFNLYCKERALATGLDSIMPGDVLMKNTGGIFWSDDNKKDQDRINISEVGITGPIFGPRMFQPMHESALFEGSIIDAVGMNKDTFLPFIRIARGTRRRLLIKPLFLGFQVDRGTVELSFFLPPGSYATVMLRELVKKIDIGA